jgi:hypothetical protein
MTEDDDIAIQFGITIDEDGTPVVLMTFPGVPGISYGPDDDDELSIIVGTAEDTSVFATHLLRAGQVAVELGDAIRDVEDRDELIEIISEYAKRINSPYN